MFTRRIALSVAVSITLLAFRTAVAEQSRPSAAGADNATVLEARRAWAALEAKENSPRANSRNHRFTPRSKLRIGHFSAFFSARNWMKPGWGVIKS